MAKTKYGGDLAKRLPRRRRQGLLQAVEASEEWDAERKRRFLLLLRHYGLSPGDRNVWLQLAIALAANHVPGLQEYGPTTRGRPPSRSSPERREHRAELLKAVTAKQMASHHSDSRACILVQAEWKRAGSKNPLVSASASYLRSELSLARREEKQGQLISALRGLADGTG